MMVHYPDMFIMTFSIHIPNFALLSQSAQLLLIFCYAASLVAMPVKFQLHVHNIMVVYRNIFINGYNIHRYP